MDETTFIGLQFQTLLIADDIWVHDNSDSEVEDPHFSGEELGGYIRNCMAKKGIVTANLGIYQDGSIGEKTLAEMKKLKAKLG